MFDTLITNGTIIDGSNKKSYKGDIGIIGEKIDTIGLLSNAKSKEVINAKDSIVCPGFIDVHSHDDFKILSERKITHNILQGITTMIVGNCGFGISPYGAAKEQMSALYQVDSLKYKWDNFADFFDLIEKNPPSINVGVLIGHHTIRRAILNEINKKIPNSDELNKMIYLVEEGMEAGCLGFSTGLVYEPGRYSNTEEIINLTKPLKKYNGVYVSHMRNEAEKLFHSISETINIGTKAGTKIQISHLKSVGKENWGKVGKALEIIENHNLNGIDITADQYPYTARSTMLKALYINGTFNESSKYSPMGKSTSNEVLLCSVPGEESLEGKTLEDIQNFYDLPTEETVEKLIDVSDKILVAAFGMKEEDVVEIMQHKLVMIGTDGLDVGSKPHPRAWGTYPRILEEYVKKRKSLKIENAIHKMTEMPAKKFNIKDRGLIKKNNFADLVIFNESEIKDNATYTNPKNGPDGISFVFVNGKKSVIAGKETLLYNGELIRAS